MLNFFKYKTKKFYLSILKEIKLKFLYQNLFTKKIKIKKFF